MPTDHPTLLSCLRWRPAAIGLACSLLWAAASAQTVPSLQPSSGPWDSGAGFHFDLGKKKALKTRQSLSGLACTLNAAQQRICLAAFDEGVEARFATLGKQALIPDAEPVRLRSEDGELDAEGAATDGQMVYVTGSHSAKRNSCDSNPDSRHVLRFRLDPATGRALRNPNGSLVDYADTQNLWSVMQAQPGLQAYVGERKCLGSEGAGQNGVNIEGLALQNGRLYFGFRGPALDGTAGVLAVDADALFSGGEVHASLTPLALGPGRGIRDLVAVKTGFLVLAGPDDNDGHKKRSWTVSWWDGHHSAATATPKLLATLDLSKVMPRACDKELKPEAITVLAETPKAYQVLVLSDGMCDGGPLAFTLPR